MDNNTPQLSPVIFRDQKKSITSAFKFDQATLGSNRIVLHGWATSNCRIEILSNGIKLPSKIKKSFRPDVAAALQKAEPSSGFGITIYARTSLIKSREFQLCVHVSIDGNESTLIYPLDLYVDENASTPSSDLVDAVAGCIEVAGLCVPSGEVVVAGWSVATGDIQFGLETDSGEVLDIDAAYRFHRQDVVDVHFAKFGVCNNSGFIARVSLIENCSRIYLVTKFQDKVLRRLCEIEVSIVPNDPLLAARWLSGLLSPNHELAKRLSQVDLPLIEFLTMRRCEEWNFLPVTHKNLGTQVVDPKVSIIVPLYRRSDFVEHQLIEFSRDPWLLQNSEIIYVIDDVNIFNSINIEFDQLRQIYQVPFRWIWGSVNRGFSGANNLGTSIAHGNILLFLNSDVIPSEPGWLKSMYQVLVENPEIGVVAPRLLFPDGSIQHAGMNFIFRDDLSIWVNHHPLLGSPPELDPNRFLTLVPAVTGACLAIRRFDFDRIGGWDTGYLIGDFEDSDLCFKIREISLEVGYLPLVQLTHLERQSFRLFDHRDDFRNRVVMLNALRHQRRWLERLPDFN